MSRKEYEKQWQKKRRKTLRENNLCTICGKVPPAMNKKRCERCSKREVEAVRKCHKKRSEKFRASGLCTCGAEPIKGKRTCTKCIKRTLQRYYNRKEKGLCAHCSSPSIQGMTKCQKCANHEKERRKELRKEVFEAYGGCICNCCKETVDRFLTLDHTNNDGKEHRKLLNSTHVFGWLKKNNYPEGFQVLCFNCNLGRQLNGGICPHKFSIRRS